MSNTNTTDRSIIERNVALWHRNKARTASRRGRKAEVRHHRDEVKRAEQRAFYSVEQRVLHLKPIVVDFDPNDEVLAVVPFIRNGELVAATCGE